MLGVDDRMNGCEAQEFFGRGGGEPVGFRGPLWGLGGEDRRVGGTGGIAVRVERSCARGGMAAGSSAVDLSGGCWWG